MSASLRKGFLLFIFCSAFPAFSFAQKTVADSIKQILGFSNDEHRIRLLFQLTNAYLQFSPKQALETAAEARVSAVQLGNDSLEAESIYHLGKANSKTGKFKDAIANFEDAEKIFRKLGDAKMAAMCVNYAGEAYHFMGQYNEALNKSFDSYREFEAINDRSGMSDALILSGLVYEAMKNYDKAIIDLKKAFSISKEANDVQNEASCLNNLASVYSDLGKMDTVYTLWNQSLDLYRNVNDKYDEGKILNNIGTAYLDDSVLDKAENYFLQALDIRKQIGDKRGQSISLANLGAMECAREDWDKALVYFERALVLAKGAEASDIMIVLYQNIAEVYTNKQDYQNALIAKTNETELKDSIFDKNLSENIAEMQAKYDVEKAQNDVLVQQKQKKLITTGSIIGGILLLVILFFFVNRSIVRKRTNTKLNAQKEEIEQKNSELHHANREIELKNKDITDSILYASRIQEAILPEVEFFNTFQEKGFVLYRPKDIVSGDFYWMAQTPDHLLFAAVDCTGHGVPGAFMSIVCSNLLTQAVKEHGHTRPDEILNDVNIRLSETLRQRQDESRVRDGMDIALCSIHKRSGLLCFAGAYNPVFIIRNGELHELLADKFPVGLFVEEELKKFTHKEFQLQKGDRLYIASDGYADQFGGPQGKKFKRSSFTSLLLTIQNRPVLEHKNLLKKAHLDWKGDYEQIDDVLVMGIEIA